jgi:galacturonosyltransferase
MKEKGIEEYIEASEKLKRKYGNRIRFEIAGFFEEDYKSIVDDLVDNGVVTYHGFLENTYNAIARCTVVVLPSYHEGLSNVLLEAQAVGRPVIASRVPGCTETFIDGISGVSVTPRDSNDLLEKMEYMFNLDYDQKLHMGELGRKHVESQFDRTEVVNQYIKLT